MNSDHENQKSLRHPRFNIQIMQVQNYIIDYDTGGFLKYKLYENSKSRPIKYDFLPQLPEQKLRSSFDGYMDYLLYCFSLTGSLANLTRFPYLAYSYNGCSFLIKFLILVVLIGIPWCFMEIAVGQYSGRGPTAIGDMVPIGKGAESSEVALYPIFHSSPFPIQSRCLFYMYWSLPESDQLPWKQCSSVNSSFCINNDRHLESYGCKSVGLDLQVPAENFYQNKIVEMDGNILYDGVGKFNSPLLACLVISWMINYLLLTASNDLMKYVKIFGSIAPFTLLAFVSFAIMANNDAWGGFNLLFDTSTINFLDLQSWRRAAEQVLYSLDVGTGHLIIYGANRSFHNNILGGVLLVTLLDTICAVAATIVVFGTANIVSCKYHIQFDMVFKSGPGMFFVCISRVLADLPLPRVMSFVSFLTLFVICILTQGGEMIISILDDIGSAMGILMITTFEAILIFGVYGVSEFCVDLAFMSNKPPSIILKLLFIGGPVFTINFFGSFEPTDRWVPDLNDSLIDNKLNEMTFEEEDMIHDNSNQLVFGIGKPKMCMKIDKATQTDETNNQQLEHIGISNEILEHFYLEVLKTTNTPFEIERRHNETEVLAWNHIKCSEYYVDIGLMEKYCQTD
ncbi:sodium-dependent proline transporter-like [Rhopalosiphum maidis]|uniref:sodium-dependent proline transporter-like n=1 Tax=Rhopalosiphum maidis TaxID=43146 RepID=UPI000EFED697|nr:sodium-dependent proline transporter-like [Rhopalosiphum maidis]